MKIKNMTNNRKKKNQTATDIRLTDKILFLEPDRVLDEAVNRIQQLKSYLDALQLQIQAAPEGSLRITSSGTSRTHYHRKNRNDRRGQYIRKENQTLAVELVQKGYYQKLQKELEKELNALNTLIETYHPSAIYKIYENLHEERKKLLQSFIMADDEYAAWWLNQEYSGKEFFDNESTEYYTDEGVRVRSKSEIIIGNKLSKEGIPYRYEYPISISNEITLYPDFYCLNVRTRQEIIWEHFGIMDNPEYAKKAIQKLNWYFSQGFILGENLIVTFETKDNPLNIKMIEKNISTYLL